MKEQVHFFQVNKTNIHSKFLLLTCTQNIRIRREDTCYQRQYLQKGTRVIVDILKALLLNIPHNRHFNNNKALYSMVFHDAVRRTH